MKKRDIKKTKVDQLSNGDVTTYLVNGEEVRDSIPGGVALCLGGHDKAYKFIPAGEVWVEDHMSYRETDTIAFHELRERWLMLKKMDYEAAHKIAEKEEDKLRHGTPEQLAVALARALASNK